MRPISEFPVTTDIYIRYCNDTMCSTLPIKIGNCINEGSASLFPVDNNYISGVGFTAEEANSGQQECEDDTYIYRIKNE